MCRIVYSADRMGFLRPSTVSGRAGLGQDRATLAFPGGRGRFACPKAEGSGRLSLAGRLDLPSSARFQTAPTVSPLT
jgi:hypothetical protein